MNVLVQNISWKVWLLCALIVSGGIIAAIFIRQWQVEQSFNKLNQECEETYGKDNYIMFNCQEATWCCQSKDDFEKGKSLLTIMPNITIGGMK